MKKMLATILVSGHSTETRRPLTRTEHSHEGGSTKKDWCAENRQAGRNLEVRTLVRIG